MSGLSNIETAKVVGIDAGRRVLSRYHRQGQATGLSLSQLISPLIYSQRKLTWLVHQRLCLTAPVPRQRPCQPRPDRRYLLRKRETGGTSCL